MAHLIDRDHTESLRMEFASARSSFDNNDWSFGSNSDTRSSDEKDEEDQLQWAAIERLPTFERLRTSLFHHKNVKDDKEEVVKTVIDVTKLGTLERHVFIENLIKKIEKDNHRLLLKQRERIKRVGLEFPTVEVRYQNLSIDAECEVVRGKPLPTSSCRLTLLLGPPGCGKTTLLRALSGKLDQSLKPAPETFNLFDDIIFMAEGKILYHGPRVNVVEFFEHCGFKCPPRKGTADFLQEVSSSNATIGQQVLTRLGLDFSEYFYWISLGALLGFWIILNIGFTFALSFLKPPGTSRAIISQERLHKLKGNEELANITHSKEPPQESTCKARHVACFIDPNLSSGSNICKFLLHLAESVLWIPYSNINLQL